MTKRQSSFRCFSAAPPDNNQDDESVDGGGVVIYQGVNGSCTGRDFQPLKATNALRKFRLESTANAKKNPVLSPAHLHLTTSSWESPINRDIFLEERRGETQEMGISANFTDVRGQVQLTIKAPMLASPQVYYLEAIANEEGNRKYSNERIVKSSSNIVLC